MVRIDQDSSGQTRTDQDRSGQIRSRVFPPPPTLRNIWQTGQDQPGHIRMIGGDMSKSQWGYVMGEGEPGASCCQAFIIMAMDLRVSSVVGQ